MKLRTAPGSAVPFHVAATALDPSPANAIAKKTTDICLIALPLFLTAHRSYTGKAVSTMNGLLSPSDDTRQYAQPRPLVIWLGGLILLGVSALMCGKYWIEER